ncbi:MAG: hypothetical protein RIR18_278 [Pseudomonadota bacterium]|jgi:plasmid stabilization system protein ParE
MTLPTMARVEASPNFLSNLNDAHEFFVLQDADSAENRLAMLKQSLREMVKILGWSPAGGRPARFLSAMSVQAQLRTQPVIELSASIGLPSLREYVVGQHIVLYAHSETEVVLLAIKHQRQLTYLAAS